VSLQFREETTKLKALARVRMDSERDKRHAEIKQHKARISVSALI
jgi:hypothetical protein